MFERFTESARMVVVLAQEESRLLGHTHIGTEHLLLGLLRQEDSGVTAVLEAHDLTLDPARATVVEIIGRGSDERAGQIPFTPRAEKVLEIANREAQTREHHVIGPLHITLALAREGEGVAAHIMREHGLDSDLLNHALAGTDPYRDARRARLALIEARLTAWERRVELMELVAGAIDDGHAEALVAERFGVAPELARQMLDMRLQYFTTGHVEGMRQERKDLLDRLGEPA